MQILQQTKDWVAVYKDEGETPLQAIQALRHALPELQEEKMAYAGRLDPMAEGVLLILRGEACKEREKYLGCDKEYRFEVLFGLDSDTQDILGVVQAGETSQVVSTEEEVLQSQIQSILADLVGSHQFAYPVFSSKTVEGKPLFLWALEGRLDEIEIPKREMQVQDINLVEIKRRSLKEIVREVEDRVALVRRVSEPSKALGADFRREAVLASWQALGEQLGEDTQFVIAVIHARVGSGTYVRTLSHILGERMNTQALAWRIKRTKLGEYVALPE